MKLPKVILHVCLNKKVIFYEMLELVKTQINLAYFWLALKTYKQMLNIY